MTVSSLDRVECEACAGTGRYGFADNDECPICNSVGSVARVASAAQSLVRVLLAIEWSGCDPTVGEAICPSCGEPQVGGIHAPDCALEESLRRAGVR